MAGEVFRKGFKDNEAAVQAKRMVETAKVIVDAASK
jgi:hypothetical protein